MIGSYYGLSLIRCQATVENNASLLSIGSWQQISVKLHSRYNRFRTRKWFFNVVCKMVIFSHFLPLAFHIWRMICKFCQVSQSFDEFVSVHRMFHIIILAWSSHLPHGTEEGDKRTKTRRPTSAVPSLRLWLVNVNLQKPSWQIHKTWDRANWFSGCGLSVSTGMPGCARRVNDVAVAHLRTKTVSLNVRWNEFV